MVYTRTRRAINSPRHLVLRNARRLIEESKDDGIRALNDEFIPKLEPGEEQLYSFYVPGLEAGAHKIDVQQDVITIGDDGVVEKLTLNSLQQFNVVAPLFTLPEGSIHSVYPPQGHGDILTILPHVVLNDPHLPWERVASSIKDTDLPRNRVPWLALLVFTQNELRLEATTMEDMFENTTQLLKPVKQSATLAVTMKIADLLATKKTTTPITSSSDPTGGDETEVVFLQKKLFNALVTTYDKDGKPVTDPEQKKPDVSRYKYLSHVRNINTTGMADAGVEDEGLFSIVVSHRVGPLTIKQPTPVVVHLVSIEDVESMPFPVTTEMVALSSLHSWTYICLPPGSLNAYDLFKDLGNTLTVLRAPHDVIDGLQKKGTKVASRISQRLTDGYSLTRYRTQTGELTAAFTRGPFTPTTIPYPLNANWTSLSHFGTDLQILDAQLGLMDITYCTAWQLGKTLALADQTFATALSRVRSEIYGETMNAAKATILSAQGGYRTREQTLKTLSGSVETLNNLPSSSLLDTPVNRWRTGTVETLDLSFDGHLIDPIFADHAAPVALKIAGSPDGDGIQLFDEQNSCNSSDWMLIFKWVLDRMYLVNIPAHYLITDPTHLPPESLRFFHIDANWVDALVDGALSIANHLDREDDKIRTSIKKAINKYLSTVDPGLGFHPQIPTYGFLLRSELVTQFPDLMVQAPIPDSNRAPILRHENIGNGVMLCLFDRVPSADEFPSLTFTQPAHQQCFEAAVHLDDTQIITSHKRIYTSYDPPPSPEERRQGILTKTLNKGDPNPTFLWGEESEIRTLLFPAWAQDVFDVLKKGMNDEGHIYFDDTFPGSAMVGLQLNKPIYNLEILLRKRQKALASLRSLSEGDGLRTLVSLEPRLKKVPNITPKLATRGLEGEEPAMLLPVFGERGRTSPLRLAAPPPHFRTLRAPPSNEDLGPEIGLRSSFPITESAAPAQPPQITYKVYPTNSNTEKVPMRTGIPQDLIFSIIVKSNPASSFLVREISIKVRVGPTNTDRKNLMSRYRGPGATMLSNLRFNVLVVPSDGLLNLRLLPRSTTGYVPVRHIKEMSFVLSLVNVNDYDGDVDVWTEYTESYDQWDLRQDFFMIHLVSPPKQK